MPASPDSPLVRYGRQDGVVLLTLDHPPVNVLSAAVLDALRAALSRAEADPEARAVVLASASEKAFAAGADIREMANLTPEQARRHGARGQGVTEAIERLPLPVIAAVHGSCLGGGCEIALACDLIVAADDATFGQPEILLGVMPGWGGTQRLPSRVGVARARSWIFSGRPVSAPTAQAQGLVLEVVPRADLLETALRLARELAAKPALALAAAKYAVQRAAHPGLAAGLAYELELWKDLFGTADQREGMAAFLEKRPAKVADRSDWTSASKPFPWSVPPEGSNVGERKPGAKRKNG